MSSIKFFWREFRADRSFNWFYILCASLGIIGLLLVESFKGGIENKITRNAKNFIAADLSISSNRAIPLDTINKIENYLSKNKFPFAKWVSTYSLVSNQSKNEPLSKLAELNFVSELFPFYGGVTLENIGHHGFGEWGSLHKSPSIWISRDLAWELGVNIHDVLKIGEIAFNIDGIILEDQFSSFRGFSLAPKIFISYNYLTKTELIKFGSTASSSYAIKLNDKIDLIKIQKELRVMIPELSIKIIGPTESSQQVSRALNILSDYLSLITLLTYILSLVGLYYFSQYFLSTKLKVFAIYKSLGIKSIFLFKNSFMHLILLTLFSVFISTSLILVFLPILESFFPHLIGDSLTLSLGVFSILRILLLSLGGSILALGPLFWGALQVPIATIFQDLPADLKRIKFYYFIPLGMYIISLTIYLANSYKLGGYFLGSLAIIFLSGGIFFKFFTVFLEKMAKSFQIINRHAALSLTRYFSSSFTIFICLLTGMTFTVFIYQIDISLRNELSQTYGNKRPDLFLFDLQDSQFDQFTKLIQDEKWQQTLFAPMIRGRLIKINQVLTQKKFAEDDNRFSTREDQNAEQVRNRGVNLSYRNVLSWSEKITAGVFNGKKCENQNFPCEISLEESYAKRLGVKLGDRLTFDISGVEVEGLISSFRKVKWMSFEPNFFILFQPGAIEEAPKTFLLSLKVNSLNEKRNVFSKIADHFSNVSIIDTTEIIKKITTIFNLMAIAIKFISLLSLGLALVVLSAVSINHLNLRRREMGLYFMLGLKLKIIHKIYTREFIFLLGLCSILALLFGSLCTTILMKFIFDSEAFYNLSTLIPILVSICFLLFIVIDQRIRYLLKNRQGI